MKKIENKIWYDQPVLYGTNAVCTLGYEFQCGLYKIVLKSGFEIDATDHS